MNRETKKNKKYSKYKGVTMFKGRWVAKIGAKGMKRLHAVCESELEAAIQYNKFALQYHGEFAKLNAIGGHNGKKEII